MPHSRLWRTKPQPLSQRGGTARKAVPLLFFGAIQNHVAILLHSYTTTQLYAHADCIPITLESQSLTAPPSVSSIHCRTAHLHGFPHTSLRGYATTPLHHYRATHLPSSRHGAKQRGARNGTPQDSCLLLSFLPAPFGYATIELHAYRHRWLHAYVRIMPKERRHQKGAPFNETGSPPPNSYRPPRYVCRSTS